MLAIVQDNTHSIVPLTGPNTKPAVNVNGPPGTTASITCIIFIPANASTPHIPVSRIHSRIACGSDTKSVISLLTSNPSTAIATMAAATIIFFFICSPFCLIMLDWKGEYKVIFQKQHDTFIILLLYFPAALDEMMHCGL